MKQRFVRLGDDLDDDVTIVVRGGRLDRELLRADALRNHAIYGSFGISVFAARDLTVDELAQQPPLVRFAELTLVTVGALRLAGLRLEPTGLNPRHFDVTFDDLDHGITQLELCEHRTIPNPNHEP